MKVVQGLYRFFFKWNLIIVTWNTRRLHSVFFFIQEPIYLMNKIRGNLIKITTKSAKVAS